MVVQDIAYVELFTKDKVLAVDYFVSALGFTRVADSVQVDRSSILLRQGDVQLVVTSGRGIWKFLDEHGDGIADIAMTCDDVAVTRDAALSAGARPGVSPAGDTVVSGFGDVTHTLIPAGGNPADRLPPGRNWIPSPAPRRPTGHIQALDHVAVCLAGGTLAECTDFYRDGFGLSRFPSEHVTVGGLGTDFVVLRAEPGGMTFTLVAPDPAKKPGPLDAFLERNGGAGVQHLAFQVDGITPAVREFGDRGVDFLTTADALQLFSRSPYERNTLFFELIERQGTRGFPSSDTCALREAVEGERLTAG